MSGDSELIQITEDGGIVKKILQAGTGDKPTDKSEVKVTYIGTLQNGTQFDATTDKDKGFKFQIGVGQVIKGWDLGVATMQVGERALFTIKPEYAYGAQATGSIPANSTLNFEVELLDFKEKEKEKSDYSTEERLQKAQEFKNVGNDQYKAKSWFDAKNSYLEAYDWADVNSDDDTEDLQCQKFKTVLNGNKAAVYLQLKDWSNVIECCNSVIDADPKNIKAYYRRSQGRGGFGNYEEAINDLNKCIELDPNDKLFPKEVQRYKQEILKDKKKEKNMFANMFKKSIYQDEGAGNVDLDNPSDPSNPVVFFDIQIGDQPAERIEMELFKNVVPKTAENFRQLCQTKYKGTIFHRLIKEFMIQGGDYENRNGTGGKSIYGAKFDDENFKLKHLARGDLSMANSGPNTNGSQFFICFKSCPWLDGKHVVFGKVIKNIEFLDKLEAQKTTSDAPDDQIKVVDSGEVVKQEATGEEKKDE